MATRRLALRPIHRICLDMRHTDPDQPCPYCTDPDTELTLILDAATRRHAELAAQDAETWGWAA